MAKRKMDKSLMDALDCILFEESVDEVFNLLLRFDYTNVKANLPKEGYNLNGMDEEERFLYLLSGACYEIEGGGEIGEFADLLKDEYFEAIDVLSPSSIESEPYFKLLAKVPHFKDKGMEFGTQKYDAFQPFLSKRRRFCSDFNVLPKPSIACFPTTVNYPALSSGGEIWMSLIPHEIESMKEDFLAFKGKVLIYGLGLGYAAFEAARKDDVTHVTVVEKDRTILAFFKKHILPLFPNKEKITLVEGDAIVFARTNKEGNFDILFADLWHTGEDGLSIYANLKRNEGAAKENHYWVEEEMLIFRRLYLRLIAYFKLGEKEFLEDIEPSPYYPQLRKWLDTKPSLEEDTKALLSKENLLKTILEIIE